jgi:hypothetical protein
VDALSRGGKRGGVSGSPDQSPALSQKRFQQKINPRKKDPSNIKRADKTTRRKRHLKEPARLKTPREESIILARKKSTRSNRKEPEN